MISNKNVRCIALENPQLLTCDTLPRFKIVIQQKWLHLSVQNILHSLNIDFFGAYPNSICRS